VDESGPMACVVESGDCWLWLGSYSRRRLPIVGKATAARVMWEAVNGPLTPGSRLVHDGCADARCVAPHHRREVTAPSHGTQYGYKTGCRCNDCLGWCRARARRQRRQHALTDARLPGGLVEVPWPIRRSLARQRAVHGCSVAFLARTYGVQWHTMANVLAGGRTTTAVLLRLATT
jgi:hypothetical protein